MGDATKIAPTAHYTAYAWHVLGLPYAEHFATPLGRRLFRAYGLLELPSKLRGRPSKLLRTLHNRHALIDAELERLNPDMVVELGAGLSRRGLTFALDHGVRYVELDLPAVAAFKRRVLEDHVPASLLARAGERLRVLDADILAPGFRDELAKHLAGAERPVVVAEGVVGYFEAAQRHAILSSIRGALPHTGALLTDLRVRQGQAASTRVLRLGILIATRGRGAAPSFADRKEVLAMLHGAGFTDVAELPALERDVLSTVWRSRP
ncbi:MAG: class I SAM-dependent methyltransferase [Sandaracinaceae bacterium]|nr:class I SAM-dependent methyltransferase [Sandaracinaceae bacterium]